MGTRVIRYHMQASISEPSGHSRFCSLLERRGILIHLLEVDKLSEDILQNVLCAAFPITKLLRDPEDLTSLTNVELEVVICTLVGQLRQSHPLRCKLLIQIEQVQCWGHRLTKNRRENSGLQWWHRCLELRW